MYNRRLKTKPVYVTDSDEPETGPGPGPASPSSGEDTKIEQPSPKKRFQLFSFI